VRCETHLEFEPDAVGLANVEELDELFPDAVDALDILFGTRPELNPVYL
jgi:hypothetical protein